MKVLFWVLIFLSLWVLPMSDREPRKSTVEKSRLLKEKLEARARAREIRSLESAARVEGNSEVVEEESEEFSDAVSNPESKLSLEWDSNEESTSPSFLERNYKRYASDPIVDEIIKDISILNPPTGHLNLSSSDEDPNETIKERKRINTSTERKERKRINTSTDGHFLDEIDPLNLESLWPSREPSEEPEDLRILDSVVLLEIDREPAVFEEEMATPGAKMVRIAELRVKDFIEEFPPNTANLIDYEIKLKEIKDSFLLFKDAVNGLLYDIEDTDDAMKTQLETRKRTLLNEVNEHKTKVMDKIKEVKDAQPNTEMEKKKGLLILKSDNLSSKIKEFQDLLSKVKESKESTDTEVRCYMSKIATWEVKIK